MKNQNIKKSYIDSIKLGLKLASERTYSMVSAELDAFDIFMSFKEEVEYFLGKKDIVKVKRNQEGDQVSAILKDSDLKFSVILSFNDTSLEYDDITFDTYNFSAPSEVLKNYKYNNKLSNVDVIKRAIFNICKDPVFIRHLLTYGEPDFSVENSKTTYLKNKNVFYLLMVDTFKNLKQIEKIHSAWKDELNQLMVEFNLNFAFEYSQSKLVFNNNQAWFLSLNGNIFNIDQIIEKNKNLLKIEEKEKISSKIKKIIKDILKSDPLTISKMSCEDKLLEFDPDNMKYYSCVIYNILNDHIKQNQKKCLPYINSVKKGINEIYNVKSEIHNDYNKMTITLTLHNIELFKIKVGIDGGILSYQFPKEQHESHVHFDCESEDSFYSSSKSFLSSHQLSHQINKIIKENQ